MSATIQVRLAPQLGRLVETGARSTLVLAEGTWQDVVEQLRACCPALRFGTGCCGPTAAR